MTLFLIVTYTVLVILAIAICRVASDEEVNEIKRERKEDGEDTDSDDQSGRV